MTGIKNPGLVVVTGAGSGIGRATARTFAARGATVMCLDINEVAAKETAGSCDGGAFSYGCDVSDPGQVIRTAASIKRDHGPVDVLVNNAGVGLGGDFLSYGIDDWEWIRSINLDGVVHCCHAFGPEMVDRGRGQVVNVASGFGFVPSRRTSAYCSTKAAVVMFSQCLRADWARYGVGVSVVCPGVINTPILAASRVHGVGAREHRAIDWLFKHARSPEAVADTIVRTAARNSALVPVGVESQAAYYLMKAMPARLQAVGGRLL